MDEVKSVMKHFVLHVYPDFVNLRKLGGGGGGGGGYANAIMQRLHNPFWRDVIKYKKVQNCFLEMLMTAY